MFGRLVVLPDVGGAAFCRKCPMCPEAHSPLVIRAMCSGVSPCGLHGPYWCGKLTAGGGLVAVAGPWSGWPCLV